MKEVAAGLQEELHYNLAARGALQRAQDVIQGPGENIPIYVSQMEEFLTFVDVEGSRDLFKDAFFAGMNPTLKTQAATMRQRKLPWAELITKVTKLEQDLGLPEPLESRSGGRAHPGAHTAHKVSTKQQESRPQSPAEPQEDMSKFKRTCQFRDSKKGCWICGKEGHFSSKCPDWEQFD